MISLHGVTKTFAVPGGQTIAGLGGVDLEVERGEFLVITGRSGSGKTTLLNIVAGLAKPTKGTVVLDGDDLWGLSDARRSRLRNKMMGFVFQFPSLLPTLSVLKNVTLPLTFSSNGAAADHGRAVQLLEMVGLGDRLRSYPRQLSAGQQQRVVIARALVGKPELLLADEPSSDLDEQTEREIMELFSRIHTETGITVVMVTHTSQLVAYGTRHVEMTAGQLLEHAV
jgi:ABC-type lipoprotein export system ATPase subunit